MQPGSITVCTGAPSLPGEKTVVASSVGLPHKHGEDKR